MRTNASTIKQFLDTLSPDRRATVEAIRRVILENIDTPFSEGVQNGAIGYAVPHSVYPAGYHCDPSQPLPFAGIAAQKNHIGLYLFCVYTDPKLEAWFRAAWLKAGKTLDMGKSCVRVKKLDDVPLDVVGQLFKRVKAKTFIAQYETSIPPSARNARKKATTGKPRARKKTTLRKSATKKSATKKSATKKSATKKSATKKSATKKSAKKSATKKSATKKSATKKSATKKSATKKSAAKKRVASQRAGRA